jgi:hypothetical protein
MRSRVLSRIAICRPAISSMHKGIFDVINSARVKRTVRNAFQQLLAQAENGVLGDVIEVIRETRHKRQRRDRLPKLDHRAALGDFTSAMLAALGPGEAFVWSNKATDVIFTRGQSSCGCARKRLGSQVRPELRSSGTRLMDAAYECRIGFLQRPARLTCRAPTLT